MAKRLKLSDKESTAFGDERPSVPGNDSNLNQTAMMSTEQPEMDELLENTLFEVKLPQSLTKREVEILRLIVAGNTNKEIAQEVYRTERTVEYHRHRLMRKLGVHSAADLVKRAITMGIA